MLQKNQQIEEQNATMHQRQHKMLSENQELKGKVIDLRGRLMDRSVKLNHMEGLQ